VDFQVERKISLVGVVAEESDAVKGEYEPKGHLCRPFNFHPGAGTPESGPLISMVESGT
jgi:hypothetical protein